jgi:fumarylacetoacetase
MSEAQMHLPVFVRSYTDFYASREHATNVGALFRGPENALPPNWLHIPIGYNGRASTVVVSGTDFHRPLGQTKAPDAAAPGFGPSRRLDFELELGAVVGTPSQLGRPVTTAEAYDMIFGYVLLNDWSARDIQTWEYQPLGPFQSKAFATSISPWVVTRDALEPYRLATPDRARPLLPYLTERTPNNLDIHLEVHLKPKGAARATTLARTNSRHLYYSAAQQLTHHAVCGCAMVTGDLLGSGTISGPTRDSLGALVEMSYGGREPVDLVEGGKRAFLEDGDTLTLTGWCEGRGHRIGFGECTGTVLPAVEERAW